MRRTLTSLAAVAAVAGAAVFASGAMANSFAVSIGVPGLAVGYANHGGYVAAYAPPPAYYGPAYYAPYAPAPVYGAAGRIRQGWSYYGGYRPWAYRHYRRW